MLRRNSPQRRAGPASVRDVTAHLWPTRSVVDVDSVEDLLRYLLAGNLDRYEVLWRGVANIDWAMDSGIVRKLARTVDRKSISEAMVADAEDDLLSEARHLGFDRTDRGRRLTDLELLATLQHQGAATRLLDATLNPLIGAWFMLEDESQDDADGALFGIDGAGKELQHDAPLQEVRTGEGLRWWRPPPIEPRILVQQAAFLAGPVPEPVADRASVSLVFPNADAGRLFTSNPGSGRYAKNAAWVFRVPGRVKPALRSFLADRLRIDAAWIYPDLAGFAKARRA